MRQQGYSNSRVRGRTTRCSCLITVRSAAHTASCMSVTSVAHPHPQSVCSHSSYLLHGPLITTRQEHLLLCVVRSGLNSKQHHKTHQM